MIDGSWKYWGNILTVTDELFTQVEIGFVKRNLALGHWSVAQ